MTGREDHWLGPAVIRIKLKAASIVDTADSFTARPQHITDTWEVREGSVTRVTTEHVLVCVCVFLSVGS